MFKTTRYYLNIVLKTSWSKGNLNMVLDPLKQSIKRIFLTETHARYDLAFIIIY